MTTAEKKREAAKKRDMSYGSRDATEVCRMNGWRVWTDIPTDIKDYKWYVAELRPPHPAFVAIQDLPLLKCHYCNFKNVYYESVEHHMKYSHNPVHPSPPNEVVPSMTEKDIMDWQDAMKGKKGRRSGLRILGGD